MSSSKEEFLAKLSEQAQNALTKVDITLNDDSVVQLKELNAEQLSKILNSSTDSSVDDYNFLQTLKTILKENTNLKEQDIENLSQKDRYLLTLTLRKLSLGEDISFEETKDKFSITQIIENLEKSEGEKEKVLNKANIFVHVNVPNLKKELSFQQNASNLLKSAQDKQDVSQIVKELFLLELCKYITQVKIEDVEYEFQLIDEFLKEIVKGLAATLVQDITSYANSAEERMQKALSFNKDLKVTIDSRLFT